MTPLYCPLCGQERDVWALGPYTVTLSCGATTFTGRPDPDSEIWTKWWSFDKHQPNGR